MQTRNTNSRFRRTALSAAVGFALATCASFASPDANAVVAATHIYHNHMPNFWPYYDVSKYDSAKPGDPIRYTYDGQVMKLKENPPAGYAYFHPVTGAVLPHDDLVTYYRHDAKQGAYRSWPIDTAKSNVARYPKSAVQVTMSGAVVNNLQSFADENIAEMNYGQGWANGWKETYPTLRTSTGEKALDAIHFTGHHSMGPLVGPKYFLKDLIFQNVTLQQDYFLGKDFVSSKGFFPTELGFSERLIPTLDRLGIKWSVLGDIHYSRALKDYPYRDNLAIDTLVSPPNRADFQNESDVGEWKQLAMEHEQQQTFNKFPFATTPHWVQYVDPDTAEVHRIAGIPVEQAGSWLEGWEGKASAETIKPYDGLGGRTQYYVIAHDGDNSSGRAGSYETWMNSGNFTYAESGVEGIGVNDYLKAYPIPADDVQHVQDGSWIDTRDSSADPTWYHWHIPMGIWKDQMADFNGAYGFEYEIPKNHEGTPFGHVVSMEYGYHYLERNFALLQAAMNYAETAEQIWLDGHPDYWSPKTDAEKQVTYGGNQLNPYMYSFPVKGDEANDYKGGANPAELGWYFLIASIDSGFGYYDENQDDNVKPTLGFNQSLHFTKPYVEKNIAQDRTGPSMWWVQRYPYNPGSGNASKAEGWTKVYADNTFAVYTYAYDVSGIADVKVKIREHRGKSMSPTDIAPHVYDPQKHAGPDCDPNQVGEWKTYDTKKRSLKAEINGVPWQTSNAARVMEAVPAQEIGDTYYAYISDYRDQLIDYYMEATDAKGNVTRSEIQSVYVGTGVFKKEGNLIVEDPNGDIRGTHMFMTDGAAPVVEDSLTVYVKPKDQKAESALVEYKSAGSEDWSVRYLQQVRGEESVYFKGSVSYARDSGCADVRALVAGQYFGQGNCLTKGTYTIDEATGAVREGKPDDMKSKAAVYFKGSKACVHYRSLPAAAEGGWTAVPGEAMESACGGWLKKELSLADDASGIEFLFNDCGSAWYHAANGGNYTVSELGEWQVNGTSLASGNPCDAPVANKSPVAKIAGSSSVTIKEGESAVLDGSESYDPDGSIASYKWSSGETVSKITVSPKAETVYTLTVKDNQGASSSAKVTVKVESSQQDNKSPIASISASKTSIKAGETITLDASGSKDPDGKIVAYKWSTGDTSATINVSPAADATYTVEVTDDKGATAKTSVGISVVKNHAPVVAISSSASVPTVGSEVVLTANASDQDGDAITYKWSDGSTGSSIKVKVESSEAKVYSVKATDSEGASSEASFTVIGVDPAENTKDLPAMYYAGTSNGWTHEAMTYDKKTDTWFIDLVLSGEGDSNGVQRFKFTSNPDWTGTVYGTAGGYALCAFKDKCGDIAISEVGSYRLSVGDSTLIWSLTKLNNVAPVAKFEAIVDGLTVTFIDKSVDSDSDKLSYKWSFGDGEGSSESNPVHVYARAGTYEAVLTVTDGTDTSVKTVKVTPSAVKYDPVVSALYFAGTTNGWTHQAMTFDHATGEWKIALNLTGKGDKGGAQRFKLTTSPNWYGTVYGKAGSNQLCANQSLCGDIEISQIGSYELAVNDASLTWTLTKVGSANHAPNAGFTFAAKDLKVTFANTSSDDDGDKMTYTWDFGDGTSSAEANPVHEYSAAGEYTVTLRADDGKEISEAASKTVKVTNVYIAPTQKGMYYAGTSNKWSHEAMEYDSTTGEWFIALTLTGEGDSNGVQRFKVTSTPDWKGTVWGDAGSNKLCSNQATCKDVNVDKKGNFVLRVNDKSLTWSIK